MTVQIDNKMHATLSVEPRWTGTAIGYRMAYLTADQKRALRLPVSIDYAIRVDGGMAELVKVVNGYTAHKCSALIIA